MVLIAFPRPNNNLHKPAWNKRKAAHVQCFVCDKELKTWSDLDQHIDDEHPAFLDEMDEDICGN
jgi:hypothetical protein